jgi:hypothetical protein
MSNFSRWIAYRETDPIGPPQGVMGGSPTRRAAAGASPYISHCLCMIGQICDETRLLFCRCGMPWHLETRECLNEYLTAKVAKSASPVRASQRSAA